MINSSMTFCVSCWVALSIPQWSSAQPEKSKTSSHVQVAIGGGAVDGTGKQKVSIVLQIEKGFHLIGSKVPKELEAARLRVTFFQNGKTVQADIGYPVGTKVNEEVVPEYTIYRSEVTIVAEVRRILGEKGPIEAVVSMQGYPDIRAY